MRGVRAIEIFSSLSARAGIAVARGSIIGAMAQFEVQSLLDTRSVAIRTVCCAGGCAHRGPEEHAGTTELVFPYRGVWVRHVSSEQAVADANHVLFFNAEEGYRASHPVDGGDASFVLALPEPLLEEIAPAGSLVRAGGRLAFKHRSLRIDARAQALVALLRHSLREDIAESLEAESLALTLVTRALGPRTAHPPAGIRARRRLVDRAKLLLASDLGRRWTLAEIAAEVGGSPVYLTQVFRTVEGLPLYRYQLRLRLAKALDLVAAREDLTAVALDLGFSSHSHFTSAFRQAYGSSPTAFKRAALAA